MLEVDVMYVDVVDVDVVDTGVDADVDELGLVGVDDVGVVRVFYKKQMLSMALNKKRVVLCWKRTLSDLSQVSSTVVVASSIPFLFVTVLEIDLSSPSPTVQVVLVVRPSC